MSQATAKLLVKEHCSHLDYGNSQSRVPFYRVIYNLNTSSFKIKSIFSQILEIYPRGHFQK